jgi:hydroxyethylthiazole kinase-like uncharacterized protein yjeF
VRLSPEDRIVVVCGAGNNGGDGFVVARHLLARGATVEVFLAGRSEKVMGDARIHHDAYIDLGGTFVELPEGSELAPLRRSMAGARCVVDALFGTGLDRPLRGFLAQIVELINEASCRCVALDVPSGLDADSGGALGVAILADATITFGHLKIGLLTPDGARLAGDIHVVDLGVPDGKILSHVGHTAEVIHPALLRPYFVPREANAHKHAAGNVLVIAGSPGKIGAAKLAAEAALRAGAGARHHVYLARGCGRPRAALRRGDARAPRSRASVGLDRRGSRWSARGRHRPGLRARRSRASRDRARRARLGWREGRGRRRHLALRGPRGSARHRSWTPRAHAPPGRARAPARHHLPRHRAGSPWEPCARPCGAPRRRSC